MNQKHILFPYPRIFQPPSLPENFPLLPIPPPPLSYLRPPSYLLHLISHSLHLQTSVELLSLRRHETQGLRKVESSMLKECGKEKVKGELHPKCRRKKRKVSSLPSLHFYLFYVFLFFSFAWEEKDAKKKTFETKRQKQEIRSENQKWKGKTKA